MNRLSLRLNLLLPILVLGLSAVALVLIVREGTSIDIATDETKIVIATDIATFANDPGPPLPVLSWRVGNASSVHEQLAKINSSASTADILGSCLPTTQMELVVIVPTSTTHRRPRSWILKTYADNQMEKKVGGDEFYITFTSDTASDPQHFDAAAIIQDQKDGTYELNFTESPMNGNNNNTNTKGTITIYYEYTCGMGLLSPPAKAQWKTGGAINTVYKIPNVPSPEIAPFHFPSSSPSLSSYKLVHVIGDSLMMQFVNGGGRHYKPFHITSCSSELTTKTLQEQFIPCANRAITNLMANQTTNTKEPATTALLVGSFVWDLLSDEQGDGGQDFEDHLAACKLYIEYLRKVAPSLDIYWKSGTALQIHVVNGEGWYYIDRVFYMSSSRTHKLYKLQRDLMQELHVPVLDVYWLSYLSADWLKPTDGRHYQSPFTKHMVDRFFPTTTTIESGMVS